MRHVKYLFQYLLLVGLPFIGLVGVLRAGRDLAAPMAVHGRYRVALVGGEVGRCLRTLLGDSTITVTQSGDRIEVVVGPHALRLSGQLEGDRVQAEGVLPEASGCPRGERVRFEAKASRAASEMRLDIQLRAECPACGSIGLQAARPARFRRS